MKQGTRILGVDPGTHVVGYGVIDYVNREARFVSSGAIRANRRNRPIGARLAVIYQELNGLIAHFQPDIFVLEKAFYRASAQAALRLGEGRGIALLCATQAGIPIAEYPPALVKKAIVGNGVADKSQVAAVIQSLLALPTLPTPQDATDALALALCHSHRS